MAIPSEIEPTQQRRVIDLVREAGLDVTDWANYKNGTTNPGANPKYCYEWALVDQDKAVVLNLWRHSMLDVEDGVEQRIELFGNAVSRETSGVRRARRRRMEQAIALAHKSGIPIRVVVLKKGKPSKTTGKSGVAARLLDPVAWGVAKFDTASGHAILRRGLAPVPYADQHSLPPPTGKSGTHATSGLAWNRSGEVRGYVLQRARGHCELCGEAGFRLRTGSQYLETHHVVPLSEGGADSVFNVVALCPSHHREAHYGERAPTLRRQLLGKLEQLPRIQTTR